MTATVTTKHDWTRADAMTEAEIHAAALSDPDAQPMTEDDFKRMKRTPQVKIMRRALGLSQEEFARLGARPQRTRHRRPRLSAGDRA
jgi:putative transcriptional regulator